MEKKDYKQGGLCTFFASSVYFMACQNHVQFALRLGLQDFTKQFNVNEGL